MENKSSNKTKVTNLGLGTKIRDKFANEDKSRVIEDIGLIKYNDRKDFLEAIVEASKEYQLIQHFKVAFDIDEELTEGKNIRIIIFSEDKEFFFFNNFGKIIFQEASGSDDCACFSMRWSFACPEYFNGDKDDFMKRICSAYSRFEANSREIKNILEFIERKLAQAFPENSLVLSLKENSSSLGLNAKVKSKFEKTDKGEFVEDLGNAFYDREEFISRLVDKVENLDISKSRGIYHRISNKPAEKQTYVRFEDKKYIFCTLGFRIYKDRDLFIASWGRNTSRTKPILRGEDSVILEGGRFVCNELTENNIKNFVKWFSENLAEALTLGESNVSLGLNKKIQKRYQDKDSVSDLSCVHSIDEAVKCFRHFVDHKMREDIDIEERDLSYSGIGKRVEYNATGLPRIVLVVREWDDRPGFTIHLAGPKMFSKKEKKTILKSPLLDSYICNKKKMDTIPHQGPLFQDPIDPFSFKVEVIEEIAKFFLSCIPKKFKREAVSESAVSLGLANKVQKKFSEGNPVDNLEIEIEKEKFIKLCKERFSKVRGIKNVEVGIDNDYGTILYIYPKDNLSRTIRKREIDGKNLGISIIFLRIEDNKFGLEFDREWAEFKKVKRYKLYFGVGEILLTSVLPEKLKDQPLFDLNYKNLDNATKWLEAELKRIFSEDELKESNSSLGLNSKVKKAYSKKSTSEVSEELDTLSIDAFEKLFIDEVSSLEFSDIPGLKIKVKRESEYSGTYVLTFSNDIGLIKQSDILRCGNLDFLVDENTGEILFTFWMFLRYEDSIRIQAQAVFTDESGDYELSLKVSNLHKVIDFIKKFVHDHKKDIKERLLVNESELGLNKKIQKKHSEKDAVDNISTLRPYDFRKFAQDWMSSNFVIDDKYIFSRSEEGYTRMAVDFTIPGVKKRVDDGEIVPEEYRTPVLIDYFFLKKEGESNYACKIKLYVYLKKKSFSFCMAVYNNIVIKEHGYIPSMSYPLTIGVFTEKMQELLKRVKQKDSLYETSSLGLNGKVKKKFNNADAVDNVAYIKFEDPEVERICHEHGVYTVDDAEKVTSIIDTSQWFNPSWFYDVKIKKFNEFKYFTGLKSVEKHAFNFNTELETICLPKSIETIEFGAFKDCRILSKISIQEGLRTIETCAFSNCMRLKKLVLPPSVEEINSLFIEGCYSLKSINIPDRTSCIDSTAFRYYNGEICISRNHPLRAQIENDFPSVTLVDPDKVNESNLGLADKVKKRFDYDNHIDVLDTPMDITSFKDSIEENLKKYMSPEIKRDVYRIEIKIKNVNYTVTGPHEGIEVSVYLKDDKYDPRVFSIHFTNEDTLPKEQEELTDKQYILRISKFNGRKSGETFEYGLIGKKASDMFTNTVDVSLNGYEYLYIRTTPTSSKEISKWIIERINPAKVNESNLGLNKKIQKKFDFDSPVDAIDIDMSPDDFKKILEEYLVRDLRDKSLKDKTYNLSIEKRTNTYATTGVHEYIIIKFGIKNSHTNRISFGIVFANNKTMPEKANHAYYIERVYYQNPTRGFLSYGLGYGDSKYDNIFNDIILNSEPNGYYIASTNVAADRISKWTVNKIYTYIEEHEADRRARMNESGLGLNKKVQRKFKEEDKVEELSKLDTDTFMKLFVEKAEEMKFEGFPNLSIKTKSDFINAVKIYLCNDSVGYRCRIGNLMVSDDTSSSVWVVCRLENNFLGSRHRELEILDYKSLAEALEFIKENILKYKDSLYPKAFVNESVNLGLNNKVKKRFENRNVEKEVGTMFSEFNTVEEFLDKFIEIVESYDIGGKHICFRRSPIYGDRSYFYNGELGGNQSLMLVYIEYRPETDSSGTIRGWLSGTPYRSPGKNLGDYIQFGKFIFKDNDKESNEKAHDIIDFVTEILEKKYHATMTISESNLGLNSKVKEKFSSTSVEDVAEDLASMSKEDFLKEMRLEMTKITNYAGFITFNSNDPAVLPFKDEVFFDKFYPNGRNEKGWGHFQIFRKTPNHGDRQILNLLILDQDVSRTNYPVFSCWVNWKRKDETTYYYSSKYKDFISDSDIDRIRFIEDTGIRKNRLTAYNITTLSEKIKEFFKKKYEKDFENKRKEMSRT